MRALLLLAALGCVHQPPAPPHAPTDVPLELILPTVQGPPVDVAALRGNVVVIDLMATWSVASQAEVPMFQRLLATYRERGLRMVSIAMDSQTPLLVATWVETLGISWPMALATPAVNSALGRIPEIPRTIILDRKGYVRFDQSGTVPATELSRIIESLL